MLGAAHRLRTSADFTSVVRGRRTRRAGSRLLVLYLVVADTTADPRPPRVGFIVSKAVGGSVVRNRTKRVLRHQMAERLDDLPPGTDIVVRACPDAAGRDAHTLGRELDRLLDKARTRRPA